LQVKKNLLLLTRNGQRTRIQVLLSMAKALPGRRFFSNTVELRWLLLHLDKEIEKELKRLNVSLEKSRDESECIKRKQEEFQNIFSTIHK